MIRMADEMQSVPIKCTEWKPIGCVVVINLSRELLIFSIEICFPRFGGECKKKQKIKRKNWASAHESRSPDSYRIQCTVDSNLFYLLSYWFHCSAARVCASPCTATMALEICVSGCFCLSVSAPHFWLFIFLFHIIEFFNRVLTFKGVVGTIYFIIIIEYYYYAHK